MKDLEPIPVLLSALSLGSPAAQLAADQAIEDGYAGFKALLIRKFGTSQPRLPQVLDVHAQDPEAAEGMVKTYLQRAGADRDQEVLDAASNLLKMAEAAQPGIAGGIVGQINAQGGRIVVIGGDITGNINMEGNVRHPGADLASGLATHSYC